MTAGTYLEQLRATDKEVRTKLEQLQNTSSLLAAGNRSPAREGARNPLPAEHPWEEELMAEVEALLRGKREADRQIAAIPNPDYRMILRLRYLCCNTWKQISAKMYCSAMTAYRIHKRALEAFHAHGGQSHAQP